MESIILASASPRRKDLLLQAGVPFSVIESKVDEDMDKLSGGPAEKAEKLALLKASEVASQCSGGIVLGADTIVVLEGEIFGKPENAEDARRMLSRLNGREHLVITGIALLDTRDGRSSAGHETTRVRFARLTDDEIEAYIKTGEPFGKAGAYAVQGIGALLVEGIDGCYSNVVGLPLMRLRRMLGEFGVRLLS